MFMFQFVGLVVGRQGLLNIMLVIQFVCTCCWAIVCFVLFTASIPGFSSLDLLLVTWLEPSLVGYVGGEEQRVRDRHVHD